MNEQVGEKLKKISRWEWTIGIIIAVIEVILYIFMYFGIKNAYMSMAAMQSELGIPTAALSFAAGIIVFPAMIITVLLTLYLFYKSKLMLYAYGYLTGEIHEMNLRLQKLEASEKPAPPAGPEYTKTEL